MRKPVFFIALNTALLVLVFFFLMQSLLIIQMLGTVDQLEGSVQVRRRGGDWRPLALKEAVHASDEIRTASDSRAELRWRDGTRMRLGPSSQLTIRKFSKNAANKARVSLFELTLGRVWVRVVQAMKPASRFEIETPTAVAAVRGTIFSVAVGTEGTTSVSVFDGKVQVRDTRSQELEVEPGRVADITKATTQGRAATPQDIQEWESQARIVGPALLLEQPTVETTAVSTPTVRVTGYVEPGATLSINGVPITLRGLSHGEFKHSVALQPGRNTLTLVATDQHGRQTSFTRNLVRTEPGAAR